MESPQAKKRLHQKVHKLAGNLVMNMQAFRRRDKRAMKKKRDYDLIHKSNTNQGLETPLEDA